MYAVVLFLCCGLLAQPVVGQLEILEDIIDWVLDDDPNIHEPNNQINSVLGKQSKDLINSTTMSPVSGEQFTTGTVPNLLDRIKSSSRRKRMILGDICVDFILPVADTINVFLHCAVNKIGKLSKQQKSDPFKLREISIECLVNMEMIKHNRLNFDKIGSLLLKAPRSQTLSEQVKLYHRLCQAQSFQLKPFSIQSAVYFSCIAAQDLHC